ncbi:MAG: hypothetical protein ACOC6H_04805 [Thermoproteota archaeon]
MFRQTCWGGRAIIGDSTMATMDTYDERVYAVRRGPSKVAVSAKPKTVTKGNSVIIEGTITDVSLGIDSPAIKMRFPNGVPCVRDEDMSAWMRPVYNQFLGHPDVDGVSITLDGVDPNGNFFNIGRTTSDMSGTYSYQWTPEIEGKYPIVATFE